MLIKQNGFSLLELLVSMLIVSIAMLGFAALQANSSRTLNSSYARTSESAMFQDFIKLFQVSNKAVSALRWGSENTIRFDCDNAEEKLLYSLSSIADDPSVLANGVVDLCNRLDNVPAIINYDIDFMLTRVQNSSFNVLNSYTLVISFAYLPKKTGVRTDQTNDYVEVTTDRFCPVDADASTPDKNETRVANGVVCSKVEVML